MRPKPLATLTREETMAVCVAMIFLPLPRFCRADTRTPFFAPLKLASMKDFARIDLPAVS